ncbi:hypothetical protein [Halorubrum sp. FL23]|uniref:hypothetical protein n=1 Tax=Halorubrum sp. FL23 TaxID=3458704 RepID=UPI004034AB6F
MSEKPNSEIESNRFNRRRLLATTGVALGGGLTVGTTSVSADSCEQPDWLEDGSEDDYDEENVVESDTDEAGWVHAANYFVGAFENASNELMFECATAVAGFDYCGDASYDAYLRGHGTKIDVDNGSLYANQDSDSICVWPEGAGESSGSTIAGDLAWTAAKGAVGLINPQVGATVLAADLVATAVFAEQFDGSDGNNSEYYAWAHQGGYFEEPRYNQLGHVLDFYVKPDDTSGQTKAADVNFEHYVSSNDIDHFDSNQDPSFDTSKTYNFEYYDFTNSLGMGTMLDEDELERKNFPSSFAEKGPVRRLPMENASMTIKEREN